MDNREVQTQNSKRYRFYTFEGFRFPGEMFDEKFLAKYGVRRILSINECPLLGECLVYGIIRVEYTPPIRSRNIKITWAFENVNMEGAIKPWKDDVEKAIVSSDDYKSLVRAVTKVSGSKIPIPFYSWRALPLYADSNDLSPFNVPFYLMGVCMDFFEVARKNLIDKPVPGEWEEVIKIFVSKYKTVQNITTVIDGNSNTDNSNMITEVQKGNVNEPAEYTEQK